MTIFERIVNKEVKVDILYENEYVLAFKDINPQAKVHLLIIPKKRIENIDSLRSEDLIYISEIFRAIPIIAATNSLTGGYRVITNNKSDAGQEIYYLHFHILGGERLGKLC